jgi:hypothetical protein
MKTEIAVEIAASNGIAVDGIEVIELLSKIISSLQSKYYSDLFLPKSHYVNQIALY